MLSPGIRMALQWASGRLVRQDLASTEGFGKPAQEAKSMCPFLDSSTHPSSPLVFTPQSVTLYYILEPLNWWRNQNLWCPFWLGAMLGLKYTEKTLEHADQIKEPLKVTGGRKESGFQFFPPVPI